MAVRRADTGAVAPVLRFLDLSILWLARLNALGAALALGVMFILLVTNVVLRYLFARGIAWAYEIHVVLLPWVIACGMVLAACEGRHVAIRVLVERLGARGGRILAVGVHGCVLAICLLVLWASPPVLRAASLQRLATLGITQLWGYAGLVWAFAAIALTSGLAIVRLLAGSGTGTSTAEERPGP